MSCRILLASTRHTAKWQGSTGAGEPEPAVRAGLGGFEPPTAGLRVRCSTWLSHRPADTSATVVINLGNVVASFIIRWHPPLIHCRSRADPVLVLYGVFCVCPGSKARGRRAHWSRLGHDPGLWRCGARCRLALPWSIMPPRTPPGRPKRPCPRHPGYGCMRLSWWRSRHRRCAA